MTDKRLNIFLRAVIALLSAVAPLFAAAEETLPADSVAIEKAAKAAGFFASAPASIFPSIDTSTRLDMIDYFNAGSSTPSKNAFGGDARILESTQEQITVRTSPVSTYSLSLLPVHNDSDTLLLLVRTLDTPAPHSTAWIYTSDWKKRVATVESPQLADWILPSARKQKTDLENAVPYVLSGIVYDPSARTLTFTNSLEQYIPDDRKEFVASCVAPQIVYVWNGHKFVRRKN